MQQTHHGSAARNPFHTIIIAALVWRICLVVNGDEIEYHRDESHLAKPWRQQC